MKNLTTRLKLWLLTGLVTISFLTIGVIVNTQVSTLKTQYEKSKSINRELGALKSMLIGGLLVNSATNVFILDSSKQKPIKTISSGIEKVKSFAKN